MLGLKLWGELGKGKLHLDYSHGTWHFSGRIDKAVWVGGQSQEKQVREGRRQILRHNFIMRIKLW